MTPQPGDGRATLIKDVVIAEPERSRRRLFLLIEQYYRRSAHWDAVRAVVSATHGVRYCRTAGLLRS